MAKIIKKVTLNAPASTSTGVDPTKGTEENPYTKEEYDELRRLGLWTHGWFVEGIGIVLPDVVITSSYPYDPIEDEDDDWNNDDDWDDDGINPHPNPSPDETGGNGGNYPPGGGGGNGTGGGNGNNGGGNGNGQNNSDGRKHYEYSISSVPNSKIQDFENKIIKTEIDGDNDYFIVNNERYKCDKTFKLYFMDICYKPKDSANDRNKLMVIEGGTWKLYKLLVENYSNEGEWQIVYNGGATPSDDTKCVIRTIFVYDGMCGDPIDGFNSMVHSHPYSDLNPSDPDKYAAYIYEKEGYSFFGIVNSKTLIPKEFEAMSYGEAIRYNPETN
ncbi:MAG: hypothetical protein K6E52_11610 [Bacteroidaceae bacterium]|nr:hypothetical protein [Bacteroidaceae bacterium]